MTVTDDEASRVIDGVIAVACALRGGDDVLAAAEAAAAVQVVGSVAAVCVAAALLDVDRTPQQWWLGRVQCRQCGQTMPEYRRWRYCGAACAQAARREQWRLSKRAGRAT